MKNLFYLPEKRFIFLTSYALQKSEGASFQMCFEHGYAILAKFNSF